jgi:hypothetical protein
MTLRQTEGFDHYAGLADIVYSRWTDVSASSGLVAGRFAGKALSVALTTGTCTRAFPASYSGGYVGVAIQQASSGGAATGLIVLGDSVAGAQISAFFDNLGNLKLYSGAKGTLLGSATVPIPTNGWYYLELGYTISTTAGYFEARVGGTSLIKVTGVDTQPQSVSTVDQIAFSLISGNAYDIDDMYVLDTAGTTNNSFLGDVRVEPLFPTGAGAHTTFSPYPAANANYVNVSETAMDGDATYNFSQAVGALDSFVAGQLSNPALTIFGVGLVTAARRDASGSRALANYLQSGSATALGASVQLGATYAYQQDIFETDPATSAAWTQTGIDNMQIGYEVTA